MLLHLQIKNLALLNDIQMDFTSGLNVLTGETGAGKSILVDSLKLALGEKNVRNLVSNNSKKATVEAVFSVDNNSHIHEFLNDLMIDVDDEEITLVREITSNGRSICRINGTVVSASQLRTVSSYLIDIYGQHDYTSLLMPSKHLDFLDTYASRLYGSMSDKKLEVRRIYKDIQDLYKEHRLIDIDPYERERQLDIIEYQFNEITSMNLVEGEDEVLEEERNKLIAAEEIQQELLMVIGLIKDNEYSTSSSLGNSLKHLERIVKYDVAYQDFYNRLLELSYELEDLSREILTASYQIVPDEEKIDEIENRIENINTLKRKYGNEIEKILAYGNRLENEIDELKNNAQRVEDLNNEIKHLLDEYYDKCLELSKMRKAAAAQLKIDFETEVSELGMDTTTFFVEFDEFPTKDSIKENLSSNGLDKVEFYISTNKGNDPKPLSKVLSGGELSRSMLAMKTICVSSDEAE